MNMPSDQHSRQDRCGSGRLTIAKPKGDIFEKRFSRKTSLAIWLRRKETPTTCIPIEIFQYGRPSVPLYRNDLAVRIPKRARYFCFSGVVERVRLYLPVTFTGEDSSKSMAMYWMLQNFTNAGQTERNRATKRRASPWTVEGRHLAARRKQLRVFQ